MEPLDDIPSANATFPYEDKLAAARRYLASRGITDPKPVYHSLPSATTQNADPAGAVQRAHARWFASASAGNAVRASNAPRAASVGNAVPPSTAPLAAASPDASAPVQRVAGDPLPAARTG